MSCLETAAKRNGDVDSPQVHLMKETHKNICKNLKRQTDFWDVNLAVVASVAHVAFSTSNPVLTQQRSHARISSITGVQVDLVWVESGRCDGQVTTQSIDVLDQGHVHIQTPLPGGLLGVTCVDARTSGVRREKGR